MLIHFTTGDINPIYLFKNMFTIVVHPKLGFFLSLITIFERISDVLTEEIIQSFFPGNKSYWWHGVI
jgi:hypothetical protein